MFFASTLRTSPTSPSKTKATTFFPFRSSAGIILTSSATDTARTPSDLWSNFSFNVYFAILAGILFFIPAMTDSSVFLLTRGFTDPMTESIYASSAPYFRMNLFILSTSRSLFVLTDIFPPRTHALRRNSSYMTSTQSRADENLSPPPSFFQSITYTRSLL